MGINLKAVFAATLAKKIGVSHETITFAMRGIAVDGIESDVVTFAVHAEKTITDFEYGFLKQFHIDQLFTDIEALHIGVNVNVQYAIVLKTDHSVVFDTVHAYKVAETWIWQHGENQVYNGQKLQASDLTIVKL